MAIKTSKQMPYQWLYNPIIKIPAIGCMIEVFGNVIKTLKYICTSHNPCQCLLLYNLAEHSTSSLGRFLEYWKCNIEFITHALLLCLIYIYARCLRALGALEHCAYISGKVLLPVL